MRRTSSACEPRRAETALRRKRERRSQSEAHGMSDKLRIERTIAGIGLGVVMLGCVAILWPFATTLLWAMIIVITSGLQHRSHGPLSCRQLPP